MTHHPRLGLIKGPPHLTITNREGLELKIGRLPGHLLWHLAQAAFGEQRFALKCQLGPQGCALIYTLY